MFHGLGLQTTAGQATTETRRYVLLVGINHTCSQGTNGNVQRNHSSLENLKLALFLSQRQRTVPVNIIISYHLASTLMRCTVSRRVTACHVVSRHLLSSRFVSCRVVSCNVMRRYIMPRHAMQGKLQANSSNFPSGIKALADYVHSKGLKLGIYADAG